MRGIEVRKNTLPKDLSKEDIIKLYQYLTEKDLSEWIAQKYFIFCYLDQGMNFTALAKLTWKQIGNERLTYTRNKTLKHLDPDIFSIKVTDETQ
ncbi:hypothetical protein PZB74_13320 [Porifericola rhodea]|uniref:hypothetical protein n=1 Tax=Porifericola rhodea TaxID=930972 RepID=UPI0026664A4B|nr:hypothetical protein [Porifericola rhodea]WKN29947.1 hypothetical protein PZB74_13320 [Porifericola rhodea]